MCFDLVFRDRGSAELMFSGEHGHLRIEVRQRLVGQEDGRSCSGRSVHAGIKAASVELTVGYSSNVA